MVQTIEEIEKICAECRIEQSELGMDCNDCTRDMNLNPCSSCKYDCNSCQRIDHCVGCQVNCTIDEDCGDFCEYYDSELHTLCTLGMNDCGDCPHK